MHDEPAGNALVVQVSQHLRQLERVPQSLFEWEGRAQSPLPQLRPQRGVVNVRPALLRQILVLQSFQHQEGQVSLPCPAPCPVDGAEVGMPQAPEYPYLVGEVRDGPLGVRAVGERDLDGSFLAVEGARQDRAVSPASVSQWNIPNNTQPHSE